MEFRKTYHSVNLNTLHFQFNEKSVDLYLKLKNNTNNHTIKYEDDKEGKTISWSTWLVFV